MILMALSSIGLPVFTPPCCGAACCAAVVVGAVARLGDCMIVSADSPGRCWSTGPGPPGAAGAATCCPGAVGTPMAPEPIGWPAGCWEGTGCGDTGPGGVGGAPGEVGTPGAGDPGTG